MRSIKFRWGAALVLLAFGFVQVYGSGIAPSAYQLIMQAGAALTRRNTVNFTGAGVSCVDNAGLLRTDCTVAGVGASGSYLFSATGSATNAAAAEATIIGAGGGTLTLPAGYFGAAGTTVMVAASGYYSTPIAPGTLRIRLKIGAATVLDTGAWTPLPSIANGVWEVSAKVVSRSVGVGGTVMAQAHFRPDVGVPVGQDWPMLNTAAVALDTTLANAVDLTAQWSAAGGETITGTNFLLYGVTAGTGVSTTGYATIQNNATPITQRATANFGSGVFCVDNGGSGRSDCYAGFSLANEAGTGTTAAKLAKLTGAPSTVIISTAGDTSGAVGIVVAGAGAAGSAVVATSGIVNCVFDGATTAGHYVGISAGTAGDCTNAGATYPQVGQVIGRVLSTNVGAGTYTIALFPPETPPSNVYTFGCTYDGGGATVTVGSVCYSRIPRAGTIIGYSVVAVGVGPTTTVDVWKVATGGVLPTNANTITGGQEIALAANNAVHTVTPADTNKWNHAIAAYDMAALNVDACANATWMQVLVYYLGN